MMILLGLSIGEGVAAGNARLVSYEGKVELLRAGANQWVLAETNVWMQPGDALRTGERTRALVRLDDRSVVRIDANSFLQLDPPVEETRRSFLNLIRGAIYFFHRDRPIDAQFKTPLVSGAIRGTEFNLVVGEGGRTVLTLIDGAVEMENALGGIRLAGGEEGICEPAGAPRRTAVLDVLGAIQWCLYYPAVVDLDELELEVAAREALAGSLEAYQLGALMRAMALYPAGREPATDGERVYLATLLLGVGRVVDAQRMCEGVMTPAAEAVRGLIGVVTGAAVVLDPGGDQSASVWLAESYVRQSEADLDGALEAARSAVACSPRWGFGWERVAELEFSFGRIRPAGRALERALELSPEHGQALALKGFLLAAERRTAEALTWFERAVEADGGLANAWLGRGLTRINLGDREGGREDLLIAAALEPNRALLRSYLAKAFSEAGAAARAEQELELARRLDPGDPTPWLYGALMKQQGNRINEAIGELEVSKQLNDRRRVYRSGLLLDQDQAVRSANLAGIYRDADMTEVSLEEAATGVNLDYANHGSHLFLGNSYLQFDDAGLVNQRYETARVTEFLLASLLSPVSVGSLSPALSQQEYSRMFDRNRFGLLSTTEYASRGDWRQRAAQFGQWRRVGYALEFDYLSLAGQGPNADLEQGVLSLDVKVQLAPRDQLVLVAAGLDSEGGDLAQHYDPASADSGLRVRQRQEGTVLAGYHREWQPGVHTLFLAGRLPGVIEVENPGRVVPAVVHPDSVSPISAAFPIPVMEEYRGEVEIYTAELQQILQTGRHTLVLGGRVQSGSFDSRNRDTVGVVTIPITPALSQTFFPSNFDTPVQEEETDFRRWSVYAYPQVDLGAGIRLSGGVSYDRIRYPSNFGEGPVVLGEEETDQVSPKAGVVWTPGERTTVRAAYTRSLGGVSLDQSFRLEPSQVAGFNQAWRSLIPESVEGVRPAEDFETWGISFHHRFPTRTYLTVMGEVLESEASRRAGAFDVRPMPGGGDPFIFQSEIAEEIDFRERSVGVVLNQLLGEEWSVGASYRLSEAELDQRHPGIPATAVLLAGFERENHLSAVLHEVVLRAAYFHPGGFFASGRLHWYGQSNQGYAGGLEGDDFWQGHLFAGYRFPGRQAEVRVGLLNVTGQDYRLNPLNLHADLPRDRTVTARLTFWF